MTLDSMREARSLFAFLRDLLKLRNRPMPVLSGATPQETYAAEINMQ
jgi:hypothetical protein